MDSHPPLTDADARHAAELLELGDAFLEVDRGWVVVRVNRNQEQLSRRPRAQTLGRVLWEVWPETAAHETLYWREYHRCMEERVPVQFEDHYAPLDLWTAVTAYPVSTGGIAVFFRDVTRIKRAELEQARLASIVETTDDAVLSKDLDGIVLSWNAGAERLFGYAAAEIVGKPINVLLPEDRLDEESRILSELRAGRRVDPFETVRVRKDGSKVDVSVTISPLRDSSGHIVGASKIARDLTQQRRAVELLRTSEAALRANEEQLRSVLENMAEGLVLFDASGNITYQNPASVRIHDRRLVGERQNFEQLVVNWRVRSYPDGAVVPSEQWAIPRVLRGEQVQNERFFVDCLEDARRSFVAIYSGCPVYDADGSFKYGFLTLEDITDQARAEAAVRAANESLRAADRRKDEFLGMLSHELRNPLAPIRNSLFILDRVEPASQAATRAREVIDRQVGHLSRLVDDLLDVTRIARGKIELRRSKCDFTALARRTAEDYRALLHERGLGLTVYLPDEALLVLGDETRLAQVLGNLLSNAAKFTPTGGRVSLALEKTEASALLRIRDTGVGIAPDLLPTIFAPFTQGKQTLARSEGGLGLGLALVKGLTELHGGRVAATSTPGSGSEFTLELPLAPAAEPARRASISGRGNRSQKVLVVDDNVDAAESLAELVRMFGHEVAVAYDGPSAVESGTANPPDVVLCDIGLPGMDGYEVARALRARLAPSVRLVAVSGYATPEDVQKAGAAGFDTHIAKPADPAHIERLLA